MLSQCLCRVHIIQFTGMHLLTPGGNLKRCWELQEAIRRFGDLVITSLLFANYVVLLDSSDCDLQRAPGRFAAECEVVRMRVSISRIWGRGPLPENDWLLPLVSCCQQVFQGLVLMERETERQIGAASVGVACVCCGISPFDLHSSPNLPKLWVVTKGMRSRIISFPCKAAGRSLRCGVKSSDLPREFGSRASAPSHQEESAKVVQASD